MSARRPNPSRSPAAPSCGTGCMWGWSDWMAPDVQVTGKPGLRGRPPEGVGAGRRRLALLDHHYRPDWEWTGEDLPRAARRLDGWRAAPPETNPLPAPQVGATDGDGGDQSSQIVGWYLDDDLDTPGALAALDSAALAGIPVAGGACLLGVTL